MPLSDAATIQLSRDLYPKLTTAAASDAYLTTWLPWARGFVGVSEWGSKYDTGVAMMLAHRAYGDDPAELLGTGGAAGPVSSITTLGMSASFGSNVTADAGQLELDLATTKPGRDFMAVRATLPDYVLPQVVSLAPW